MNDFKSILDRAVSIEDGPVDPRADLARGRRELRKQRLTYIGMGAAGLAVIAVVGGVVATGGSATPAPPAQVAAEANQKTPKTTPADELPGIALVAYTGEQVPGYRVGFVPDGWEIQGGNSRALLIASEGFKNQDLSDYVGKIVVMLESKDATGDDRPVTQEDLDNWGMKGTLDVTTSKVTVNGDRGSLTRGSKDSYQPGIILRFADAQGHQVVLQAPLSLGWNDKQWVEFAEGIKVLGNAEAGNG